MPREPREVVLERERRAWELRQARQTHAQIAAALDLERSTVTKILGRLHARYAKELLADIAAVQGAQIVDLEYIRDAALAAWQRSQQPAETITTKTIAVVAKAPAPDAQGEAQGEALPDAGTALLEPAGLADLPAVETTRRLAGQSGNPAFLAEARGALADIRKITGAEARDISDDALNDAIERELARLAGQGPPPAAARPARPPGG